LQEPIDGPVAAALAETFARQWPDDNRAGELFYNAAMKLDRAWSIRIGLVVLMVVIGALVAATSRNRPPRPRRRWMLTVVLGLLGIAILAAVLVTWGVLPGARQMAITSMLVQMVFENVRSVVWTSRTAVVVALSVAAALTLVIVRRRYFGTFMQRVSAVRLWVIGFSAALAVCCAMDASLVSHKRTELARRIVDEYPDSFRGRMVRGQDRQRERIGQPFELEFTDAISGRTVSMKQFRGKIVVVDFWATSCGPCRREIPELKRLYAQYHDQGVEFIGVSQDGPEEDGGFAELKSFVAKEQIPWPQFYEGHDSSALLTGSAVSDFSESWGIEGIPTVFLIDADGNLYSTEAQGKLDTLIPKLLKMPNTSAL
jgi:thiol-disulfide isomerase/thioredoxin